MNKPPTECRLLIDPPAAGAWNMAVDEVLLEWATAQNNLGWRIYGWEVPTLSLGYFQTYADRCSHAPSRDCAVVRRLTGGGAIVHDVELTYSLVVPGAHPLAKRRDLLYNTVHKTLIDTLAELGAVASLRAALPQVPPGEEPFLCFRRRSPGDVLVDTHKVAGSAQRRRRGAVLQHGSVLLGRSRAAPALNGLTEITGKPFHADQVADAWLKKIAENLFLAWRREPFSEKECRRAEELVETRYATAGWTEHRHRETTPPIGPEPF